MGEDREAGGREGESRSRKWRRISRLRRKK
jgi:hypothetical protein